MKLFHIIYLLWHIGIMCFIGLKAFRFNEVSTSEIWGLSALFLIFSLGLLFFYNRHFKLQKPIEFKSALTIMSAEFLLLWIIVSLVFMFYLGLGPDSPPG